MSSEVTRSKLINVIAREMTTNFNAKLKIQDICEAVGISRQAFNRYYPDLKPYIKGEKPISELVTTQSDIYSEQLLAKYQSTIKDLQDKLNTTIKNHEEALLTVKNDLTTSLMNKDLALYDTNAVRQELQKQRHHADKLMDKINYLEQELYKKNNDSSTTPSITPVNRNVQVIDMSFASLIKNFSDTQNINAFNIQKKAVIDNLLSTTNTLLRNEKHTVVLFIDRYLCSFNQFVQNYDLTSEHLHLFVRLPVHSRSEITLVLQKLKMSLAVQLFIPYSDCDVITKSQRSLYGKNIPETELHAADQSFLPSIKDSVEKICLFKVRQGD